MWRTLLVGLFALAPSYAMAQVSVSFYGATWVTSGADKGFFHAFMCVNTKLNAGVKEDCFGFYPKQSKKAAIGVPGKIDNLDIRRVGADVVSTAEVPISDAQRSALFKLMDEWSKRDYELTYQNCIDFTANALKLLGKKTPPRTETQTPQEFIKAVKSLNGL